MGAKLNIKGNPFLEGTSLEAENYILVLSFHVWFVKSWDCPSNYLVHLWKLLSLTFLLFCVVISHLPPGGTRQACLSQEKIVEAIDHSFISEFPLPVSKSDTQFTHLEQSCCFCTKFCMFSVFFFCLAKNNGEKKSSVQCLGA